MRGVFPYTMQAQPPEAMLRLVLLVAVGLAVPFGVLGAPAAHAQTAPLRVVWPLVPGNTWTYVTASGTYNFGGVTSSLTGAATWTALDSVDTAAGRRARLRVEYAGTTVDCAVAASFTGSSYTFSLVDAAGTGACASLGAAFPESVSGAPSFSVAGSAVEAVEVGGEPLGSRTTRFGLDDSGASSPQTRVTWRTVDALGVLSYSYSYGLADFGSFRTGTLRQATVGGATVGQPLGSRLDFWPLAAGNEWQFRLVDRDGADVGAVVWTVEAAGAGLALRTRHVRNGAVEATATCPLTATGASPASAWQTTFSLGSCALPQPYLAPSLNGQAVPLQIDTYAPNAAVVVGPQTVTADVAAGERSIGGGADGFGRRASYALARALGPVRFGVEEPPAGPGMPPRMWTATLAFARVGTTTVGAQVVANGAGPEAAALAFSAGPNPSRSAVALSFALQAAAEADVEVVDALGRTVRRVALGALPAGAGAARVDLSDLAPGAYTLRLTAGRARATARVSVVR